MDRGQRACWLMLVVLVAVGYSGWRAFHAEQRAKLPFSAIFSGHVAVVDAVDAVKLPVQLKPGDRLSERALALSAATLEEVMEVADERNALYAEHTTLIRNAKCGLSLSPKPKRVSPSIPPSESWRTANSPSARRWSTS